MTGIYPRVYDDDANNNNINWLGSDLNHSKFCSRCKVVRCIRESSRNYKCPECGLIFPVSRENEIVRVDRQVYKGDVKSAIRYVSPDQLISRIKKENHNVIKRKFGVKTIEEEDLGLGSGVSIIREWEL